ncbi:hypothetical protein [Mucilaginibacter sp. KACC 22063]|uniref:hypothetical protein n=1 Tax=Mucilaginibacter sp. KACC 22063 TaxID=3025666 RepID=UPI002365566D|nr:hypothetical protein [Mucilaginibacter sp. KACC 22063]WDF54665.1 hypothetical protein PQ461_17165 [Mucilaginibacter sp. KACC 22063]
MATNNLELPGGIKPINAVPVDAYYGPYANAAEACNAVPISVRSRGIRKVGIIQPDGSVLDYWWPGDQNDAGLVPYSPDLSGKVDKNGNKQLSDENYSTAEKIKLANLVDYYKGKYASLSALQTALPTGADGQYVIVDAGSGSDAQEYIWDSSDNTWKLTTNIPASTFSALGGVPTDNIALGGVINNINTAINGKANLNSANAFSGLQTFNDGVNVPFASVSAGNVNAITIGSLGRSVLSLPGNISLNLANNSVIFFDSNGGTITVSSISAFSTDLPYQFIYFANKGLYDVVFKSGSTIKTPSGNDFVLKSGNSVTGIASSSDPQALFIMSSSDTNYTQAEKDKLANFPAHFKGKFTTLTNAPATGEDGDYIYIDAGTGSNALEYIWDSSDNKWTPSSNTGASGFGQLSGAPTDNASLAGILNAKVDKATGMGLSTNDFTNTLLNKLNGIAAGATANTKADYITVNNGTDDNGYITSLALANYLRSYGIKMAGIDIQAFDGQQQRGITWAANTDYGKIFFHSTGDGQSQLILMAGDNGTQADGGSTSGWLFVKDVITESSMPNGTVIGNTTIQNIAKGDQRLKVLELNIDNFKYLGWDVWHSGNINKLKDAISYSSAGGTPQKANRSMPALATTTDNQLACNTGLSVIPTNKGYVAVQVNGIGVPVGDGVKTDACYFSADNGSTARAINLIQNNDKLYWNGSIAGYQLETTDLIDFIYNG